MDKDRDKIIKQSINKLKKDPDSSLGMSDSELKKYKKQKEEIERIARLEYLKQYKKDTLAQRLELAKLNFQQTKAGKIAGKLGEYAPIAGDIAKGAASVAMSGAQGVANSKMGKGILESLMYSNPVTALIAQNSDLLKAGLKVGKGAWSVTKSIGKGIGKVGLDAASGLYSLIRGKGPSMDGGGAQSLLEAKQDNKKYIAAKSATFIGGKNYILASGKSFDAGSFGGLLEDKSKLGLPGSKQSSLEDKQKDKETKQLSKGLNGLAESSKQTNKLLNNINGKTIMIAGLVILAAAALAGLAAHFFGDKIKNKINNFNNSPYNPTQENLNHIHNEFSIANKNLKDITSSDITKQMTQSNRGIVGSEKLMGGKARKWVTSKLGMEPGIGISYKGTEYEPYKIDRDAKITKILPSKIPDEYIVEAREAHLVRGKLSDSGGKLFRALNVVNPYYFIVEGQYVKKFSTIGFIGSNGRTNFIGGSDDRYSDQSISEYTNMINKAAQNHYRDEAEEFEKSFSDSRKKELQRFYGAKQFGATINKNMPTIPKMLGVANSSEEQSNMNEVNKNVTKALDNTNKTNQPEKNETKENLVSLEKSLNSLALSAASSNSATQVDKHDVNDGPSLLAQSSQRYDYRDVG